MAERGPERTWTPRIGERVSRHPAEFGDCQTYAVARQIGASSATVRCSRTAARATWALNAAVDRRLAFAIVLLLRWSMHQPQN